MLRITAKRLIWLALIGVLALATWLRIYHLPVLPFDLDGDFASCGLEGLKVLSGRYTGLTDLGWAGIPAIGYLSVAVGLGFLGQNTVGLSAGAVVMGVLTIIMVYKIGRILFNSLVGLVAAFTLTISYAHIQLSRIPTFGDPVFWLTASVLFSALASVRQKSYYWILSGATSALAFVMYFSGRIGVLIFGLIFLTQIILAWWQGEKKTAKFWLKNSSLWLLGFGILLLPFIPTFIQNWSAFLIRSREVFLFHPAVLTHMSQVYQVETTTAVVVQQIWSTLSTFHILSDTSTQFGIFAPLVDRVTFVIFLLGLGIGLRHWRQWRFQLLLAWIGLVLIVGEALTSNPPFWPRIISILIPISILAGVGVYAVWQRLVLFFKQRPVGGIIRLTLLGWGLVIFMLTAFHNWQVYLTYKAEVGGARTYIARYVATASGQLSFDFMSDQWRPNDREFDFLIPGRIQHTIRPGEIRVGMNSIRPKPNHRYLADPISAQLLIPSLTSRQNWQVVTHYKFFTQEPVFYEIWWVGD